MIDIVDYELPINEEMLEDVYGGSCVENQFVMLLKYWGLPYQAVYCNSYRTISNVIKEFKDLKKSFEYYDGFERLFSIARKLNLVELIEVSPLDFSDMLEILKKRLKENNPILIGIDVSKFYKDTEIIPLRNDHFVLLYGLNSTEVKILDDTPIRKHNLPIHKIQSIYDGNTIVFNCINKFDRNNYYNHIGVYTQKIVQQYENETQYTVSELMPNNIEELPLFRDALGIVRISRRRLKLWFEWLKSYYGINHLNDILDVLTQLNSTLDRLFSIIEAYRLRGKMNNQTIQDLMDKAMQYDNAWHKTLKMLSVSDSNQ